MTAARVLPSWRDGPTRDRILTFIHDVTNGDAPVPVEERIATFDNDGTLWAEKPMPPQLHFLIEQWRDAITENPGLATQQPYAGAASGDLTWLAGALEKHRHGDDDDVRAVIDGILGTVTGRSVEEYQERVTRFFDTATHPTLGTSYRYTVYEPMLELLRHLESHQFRCFIVSGTDRDFMRPISADYYGLPREAVIGSAVGLVYDQPTRQLLYGSAFDYIDDGPLKPVRIWSRLGRRPLLAAGNSDGDLPMLHFTAVHGPSLSLLIHHDDTARDDTPYDAGAERALTDPTLTLVSIASDWATTFTPPITERTHHG